MVHYLPVQPTVQTVQTDMVVAARPQSARPHRAAAPADGRPGSAQAHARPSSAAAVTGRAAADELPAPGVRPTSATRPGRAEPAPAGRPPAQGLPPVAAPPLFPSPFPYTALPASTQEVAPLRPASALRTRGPPASAAARLPGHSAWPVDKADDVRKGGTVDWQQIADAERMIFRSKSLKLEAALAELNLMGSQVDSVQDKEPDRNLRSRRPDPFRTALCCRLLTSLTEEMVSEQHREIFRRISYELMLSIYDDYTPPPRSELERDLAASADSEQCAMKHDRANATGLSFDSVPYFCKTQSLEEEMQALRTELAELRAWKQEKAPILREQREQLDFLTRSKGSSDLSAQIATVQQRRLEDQLAAEVGHSCFPCPLTGCADRLRCFCPF